MISRRELLKVAFRNVRRNRNRTILTVLAIVIGIFAFIMSSTVVGGIDETTIRNFLDADTAFIKVYQKDYYPDRKELYLENLITNYQDYGNIIRRAGENISVTSRLKMRGSIALASEDMPCTVIGADPENDGKVFHVLDSVMPQKGVSKEEILSRFRTNKNACLIGVKLAEVIEVLPGDDILLSGRTMRSAYNADDYTVAGIVSCGNPSVDAFAVILPLSSALEFADTGGGVSEIAVRTASRDEKDLAPVLQKIKDSLPPDLSVHAWYEELSDVLAVFKIRRMALSIIMSMLIFIAIAGITNTMLMAVMERTKEIGTLAAMGMKKREIRLLFLYEGLIIGIIGGIAAFILTAGPLAFVTNVGIQMQGTEMFANVPISSRLYGRLEWYIHPLAFLIASLAAVLASLYPADKAARMNIAETLRLQH
jgi:putative ABC transport system permease protein